MDQKAVQTNVITAVVTAVVMGILAFGVGTFKSGSKAQDAEHIKLVVTEMLLTDSGTTYGAALASIDRTLASMDSTLIAIKDDIDDLESSVSVLAAE